MLIEIVDGPIAAETVVAGMKAGSDGAVCVFDGIVRDNTRGRPTMYLDYEAYREMALEQMQRLAAEAVVAGMKAGSDGAVCVFDGIVRDNTRGRKTLYLDYEAYREMALEQMQRLSAEAAERFGVRDVAMVHRLGRLTVGETSVLIVVASAHRASAFEACRWLIDTLKKTVPIWKKETFADGAVWADGEPFPAELAAGPRGVSE